MSADLSSQKSQVHCNRYEWTEGLLERVCNEALKGSIWKPEVAVTWRTGPTRQTSDAPGWYWKDRRSDDPPVGPFLSRIGAFANAIAFHDVDREVIANRFDAVESVLIAGLIERVREGWDG